MTLPADMLAITLTSPGAPEMLVPARLPVPAAQPGEVLIRVAAAGVNAPDLLQRRGNYDPPPWHSPRLGLEVGGEIAALGDGVGSWALGAPVVALCNGGGYAEYVAVPAGQVLPLPAGRTPIEAAALPETFFTIMQTLVMRAGLLPGTTVLVHGAAGGIGGAAILIATALGARAIAVVSSPAKAEYALSLGAIAAINRTTDDVAARIKALTDGVGADRIVDIAGGDTTVQNLKVAAQGGHIVLIGTLASRTADLPLGLVLMKQLTLSGSTLRPQSNETKSGIAARLRSDIWPKVARMPQIRLRRFPLVEAAAAHAAAEQPDHLGKFVLVTPFGENLR